VELELGVGEPGVEAEELSLRRRDGVAVDDLACWAAGSMTRSWTIGGGSMGRRSAGEDVKSVPDIKLLLEFCRAEGSVLLGCASLLLRGVNEIIVSVGVGRSVLELRKEEVVTTSGVTDALDGRCAFVAAELLLPLFPEFGIRRLWANPGFAVKDAAECLLELDLPGDADVV
jgi:hypothetical protein